MNANCGNVSCFHLQRHLLCAIENPTHCPPSAAPIQCARRDLLTYVAGGCSSAALPLATLMMIGLCAATCCSCCSKCVCTHSGCRQKQLHALIDKWGKAEGEENKLLGPLARKEAACGCKYNSRVAIIGFLLQLAKRVTNLPQRQHNASYPSPLSLPLFSTSLQTLSVSV